jgi:DNA-binding NtrC family response regulator
MECCIGKFDEATGGKLTLDEISDTVTRTLVGRTVANVERDLILETLKHCFGNRTHAADILGISIRTLRNKLNEYAGNGVPVPPSISGSSRDRHLDAQVGQTRLACGGEVSGAA